MTTLDIFLKCRGDVWYLEQDLLHLFEDWLHKGFCWKTRQEVKNRLIGDSACRHFYPVSKNKSKNHQKTLKFAIPKGHFIFQPPIFRGEIFVSTKSLASGLIPNVRADRTPKPEIVAQKLKAQVAATNGDDISGQIITTSAEVTLNGGLVRESPPKWP